jgi:[protein-PII] uridylyltransferase
MKPSTQEAVRQLAARRLRLLEQVADHTGADWCRLHTEIADEVIRLVFEDLIEATPSLPPLAVVATGGYGRKELAPYSDIDLTVIPLDEAHPATDAAVRTLFRDIHTAFGTELRMDVGYAFMLINDAPGLDAKTRTSLLDSRLLAGSPEPYTALMDLFWETIPVGEFLLSKIREREQAMGDGRPTALVVEPHLKDGAGGLRSFQCANWLRAAIGEMPARPTKAYDKLLKMRNLLHRVVGKRQDVLTRARQAEIADLAGQEIYAMMSRTVEAGLELHRQYELAKEKLLEARYTLAEGVLALRGEVRVAGTTGATEAAVGIAFATQLGLRVAQIPTAAVPGSEGPEVLYAIGTGEPTLRNLDRCGLLDVLIPELTRCRFLMPTDASHDFTVFEHTMRVVRNLDSLTPGTFLGDLKGSINNPETLYLVAMLHDVGKAVDEKEHSRVGADLARTICERWRLAGEITDLVCKLVDSHLTMSIFTRMRDVLNPATAAEFAQVVGTQEQLDLLTLLTWADTCAVADGSWSPAQESFLRELHERTSAILQGDVVEEADPALYRRRLMRELRHVEESEAEVEAFLGSLQTHYLLSTPPDVVRLHMKFARKAREGEPTVELFHQPELGTTDVTVCCPDAPGLLSKVLGLFYALDLSLHSIRAATTQTDAPVALDTFTVSFGGRPVPQATCRQLSGALVKILSGEADVRDLLGKRGKDPDRSQQFYQFSYLEGNPGILEFRAPRGRGMAYRLSRIIAKQGWNIVSARVGQWAGRGAAAFYIVGQGERPLFKSEVESALSGQV